VANTRVPLVCVYAELSHVRSFVEATRLLDDRKARDETTDN
jgi:hypothetical protein